MTGTTISGVHLASVTLISGTWPNPVTVASGATISASGTALVGQVGTYWTIDNFGTITGSGEVGTGIYLASSNHSGGSVFNEAGGTISGSNHGIELGAGTFAGVGTISNHGTILGGNTGSHPAAVYLTGGGYVTNLSGGVISSASNGILGYASFTDTVLNQGLITAASNGVYIDTGGSVTNQSGGVIRAGGNGVELLVAAFYYSGFVANLSGGTILAGNDGIYVQGGTATNQGYVSASSDGLLLAGGSTGTNEIGGTILAASFGVALDGGAFTNQSGGFVSGATIGVVATGAATTLLNAGTIAGSGATGLAVTLAAGFADRLIIDPDAVFTGTVSGGNTLGSATISTLELASGSSTGTLSGLGTKYLDFTEITIDAGATWTLPSSSPIGAGQTLIDSGTIAGPLILAGGADLTNATSGLITATGTSAVYGLTSATAITVVNQGSISASGSSGTLANGVSLNAPGALTNATGGYIYGYTNAVALNAGGYVTNQTGGSIVSGSGNAVYAATASATVLNAGHISGETGIDLLAGGSVTNARGATIEGTSAGVKVSGAAGTVSNAGSIDATGTNSSGVELDSGGTVTNQTGGTIDGTLYGVGSSNAATVTNSGRIGVGAAVGIGLAFGQVTNAATATIAGTASGIRIFDGGTVVDAGTISGGFDAVHFYAGSTARLVVDPGAVFSGVVDGGNTIGAASVSTLELASGASAGTLSGLGTTIDHFGIVTIDSSATWTLLSDTLATGYTIYDSGTLTNTGTLASPVTLGAGAVLTNALGGLVSASSTTAVYGSSGGAVTVTNAGSISSGTVGILLEDGGIITNLTSSSIYGVTRGIGVYAAAGTVINEGSISSGNTRSAIALKAGGQITNEAGGLIQSSGGNGIYGTNAAVAVFNAGMVIGGSPDGGGVILDSGGYISNAAGGTIIGPVFTGAYIKGGAGTVLNAGLIESTGTDGNGVELKSGGYVSNATSGTISALQHAGLYVVGAAGTVVNAGLIASSTKSGVDLNAGGAITNQSGGTIAGNSGIYVTASSGSVINAGLIESTSTTGNGVELLAGGRVTNASTGTISASNFAGLFIGGGTGTVVNAGSILSTLSTAVVLESDGAITNQSSGTLAGNFGIYVTAGVGSIINAGLIESTSTTGVGVALRLGGYVSNAASGTISALRDDGIYIGGAAGTIVNAGLIQSGSFGGGALWDGGSVTNQTGGTITGGIGINLHVGGYVSNASGGTIVGTIVDGVYVAGGPGTVVNAGSIAGAIDAVQFAAGFTNRLVIDPGAVFTRTVDGGNGVGAAAVSTLELASAASSGTLTGLGSQYVDFAQTTIDSGASWTLTGSNALVAGTTLTNSGTLTLDSASLTDGGTLVNNGAIQLDPSTLTVGTLTGTGTVTIGAGGTLDVLGTISSGETIMFAGSGAYLDLRSPNSVSGSVTNFAFGETIDLKGIDPGTVIYSGGELQFNASNALPLALAGGNTLQIGASGDGTELTALCFCVDTMVATPSGQVKVQDLAVGDLVMTVRGQARPIMWIGAGAVLATRGRRNAATPVVVRKGALADNVPTHDLRVTKGHALYLQGALIPVELLVNHRTILWDDLAQEVALYHLELASHDVLLANGAPAESYRDDGNRWLFRNANSGWDLPPQEPCTPVLTGGRKVDAVWRRLLQRAGPRPGLTLTEDPDLHLLVDGDRLAAASRLGAHIFRLPPRPVSARPVSVRIVSRAGAPAELGLARDPRVLGVALQRIALRQGTRFRVMEAADALLEDGFHAFEPDNGLRWTNGDAGLPAALFDGFDGPMELVLHVGCTTQYVLFGEAEARAAA